MRKIKVVTDKPFHNNCHITIYDVTEDIEKKRCKILVDYAEYDIRQLISQGHDYESTIIYFKEWIYKTVRRYICDEWEYESGQKEIMTIIADHIRPYFREDK
ncbi:MAG: hypothetical protein RSD88_04355 [Anaerovoracaceae bacterium]